MGSHFTPKNTSSSSNERNDVGLNAELIFSTLALSTAEISTASAVTTELDGILEVNPVGECIRDADEVDLSLVERIELNFMRGEHDYLFADEDEYVTMGSSASTKRSKGKDHKSGHSVLPERPNSTSSVEVCTDPGLEEAEGIAHAQLLTKITSTFDCGVQMRNSDCEDVPKGFSNICDEFIIGPQTTRPSPRVHRLGPQPQAAGGKDNVMPGLNLTLTGSKAKRVERLTASAVTPRVVVTRNRHQRPRNTNVMKSMTDRLESSVRPSTTRRASNSQNSGNANRKSPAKNATVRRPLRRVTLLAAIRPSNLEEEKQRFFASNFSVNPQFEYKYATNQSVINRYNQASSMYLEESLAILERVLQRYGSYEKFEASTGGRLLTKTQIWNTVKRYLEREGFYGDIVVDISNELLSRAAMTIIGGRPTLSIRESSAREYWVEGLLRHEVGTHHLRFHNTRRQPWYNQSVRRQMELAPANPTEEGLASLHSVLLRKDPSLWRAAMLYYAVHKAHTCSFVELFADLRRFLDSPEVRWDYCLRTKRGQTDTSKPGCFCKDQVYLNGILPLLQRRNTLDFHMLCIQGKVSYEDVERLKEHCNREGTKVPTFMKDIDEYRRRLDYIVEMNGLEKFLIPPKTDQSKQK